MWSVVGGSAANKYLEKDANPALIQDGQVRRAYIIPTWRLNSSRETFPRIFTTASGHDGMVKHETQWTYGVCSLAGLTIQSRSIQLHLKIPAPNLAGER